MRFPFILILVLTSFLCGCSSESEKEEALAKRHCGNCHAYPAPELLDKNSWKTGVLPEMRFRMGLDPNRLWSVDPSQVKAVVSALPTTPMVTEEEWQAIVNHYLKNAPDSASFFETEKINTSPLTDFSASTVTLGKRKTSMITLLKFDSITKRIYVGTRHSVLHIVSPEFAPIDSVVLDSPPSHIKFYPEGKAAVLTMGNMDPSDDAKGKLQMLDLNSKQFTLLADSLNRPVHFEETDLNNDGVNEYLVACFGHFTGSLLAFEKTPTGYKRRTILSLPGIRKIAIRDMNNDGYKDIVILITQESESLTVLLNNGNFRFKQRLLFKVPPVYGSSYFEMADLNGDGFEDILYCNGDNADYSAVLKKYHGIRFFLNDGRQNFSESKFFPLHGAFQAAANDFDDDGDVDIAAISYFPDFVSQPDASFVYLRNDNGTFTTCATPLAAHGRWITMEMADLDGDKDADIILGALNFRLGVPDPLFNEWQKHNAYILKLENQSLR